MAKVDENVLRKFVRVRGTRRNYVEFDFAIGSPDLAVELIMPLEGFREFCKYHDAIVLSDEDGHAIDVERLQWRYGKLDINEKA